MLSWQDQYTLWQQLISDSDSTNLSMGKTLLRQGNRLLEAELGIYFTEETRTFTTVTDAISGTSDKAYRVPENFKSLTNIYVTVGTTQYEGTLIQDDELWRQISSTTTQSTSNFLQFVFIRFDRIELYPIPSSANTATIIYRAMAKDLQADDYTTGTITTLANAGTAVTASGSTFASSHVGRFFKINSDGEWYKISAAPTATTLTLASKYQGVAISSGTENYTIGQMPISPPDTHILPVYFAVWKYFMFKKDVQMSREFERSWKEGLAQAKIDWGNRSSSQVIKAYPYAKRRLPVNPNYWPLNMS